MLCIVYCIFYVVWCLLYVMLSTTCLPSSYPPLPSPSTLPSPPLHLHLSSISIYYHPYMIILRGVDLAIFYILLPGTGFGEPWLSPASYVQLGGLVILLFGTGTCLYVCVCVCVCMYVCLYVCMYVYCYTYTPTHLYSYIPILPYYYTLFTY
jgi:hypothetical protein